MICMNSLIGLVKLLLQVKITHLQKDFQKKILVLVANAPTSMAASNYVGLKVTRSAYHDQSSWEIFTTCYLMNLNIGKAGINHVIFPLVN